MLQTYANKLEQGIADLWKLSTTVWLEKDGRLFEAEVVWKRISEKPDDVHFHLREIVRAADVPDKSCCPDLCTDGIAKAFSELAKWVGPCKPFLASVMVYACHLPNAPRYWEAKRSDKVYGLIQSVWHEILTGNDQPFESPKQDQLVCRKTILPPYLLPLLSQRASGIQLWNDTLFVLARSLEWSSLNFSNSDLKGQNLAGICIRSDFSGSQFQDATITDATLCANFCKAMFVGANLSRSNLSMSDARGADFTGANLTNANFDTADLRNAILRNSDLTNAKLKDSDLRGADLSSCKGLQTVDFDGAKLDEMTVIPDIGPSRFKMIWKSKAPDPAKLAFKQSVGELVNIDFDGFMDRLTTTIDKARLKKALAMLKKEKFELFSEVSQDDVFGIVRSQTDPELVYSCRLGSDGIYGCCTQNLMVCGGLKGALCKHLLVLLIGLTKAAQLDPTTATTWVLYSTLEKHELDKDAMAAVFLRYKNTVSGDIDWRPTETIPEDYYAF